MKLDPLKTQGEALFEAVLDTVSDAITVIDKDLKVIFQNEAVHKTYGPKIGERCFEAYRGRQEPCENCRTSSHGMGVGQISEELPGRWKSPSRC